MSVAKQSIAISQATKTAQHLTTHRFSESRSQAKEKNVYFRIGVYEKNAVGQLVSVEELQAGKKYLLVITCEKYPTRQGRSLKQQKTTLTGPFSLSLSYQYSTTITTPIDTPPAKSFDDAFEDEIIYPLSLDLLFPTGKLCIKLNFKPEQRTVPSEVTWYTLPIRGQQATSSQKDLFYISQINRRLPEKTAILLAENAQRRGAPKQSARLRGWWGGFGQQLDAPIEMKAIISIEELQVYRVKKQGKSFSPTEILNRLTRFSRYTPPELLEWLQNLYTTYKEQLNLIIVDLTDRETPWELLELNENQYLGACVRVVRWLPTQYFKEKPELTVQPKKYTGSVISYLDEQLGISSIEHEREALQSLASQPYSSLGELRLRLEDMLEDVGLVYIGCHGTNGQHLLQQSVPELSSIKLEHMHKYTDPRLIVFINACESARTVKSSPDDYSNFVEAFLAYGAAGFIGTLARVGIGNASLIARYILLAALEPGGVEVAEILRALRKTAIEQLQSQKDTLTLSEEHYLALDMFMYVYYGNPMAHLQLYQRKAGK